jgi:hypothetical protein
MVDPALQIEKQGADQSPGFASKEFEAKHAKSNVCCGTHCLMRDTQKGRLLLLLGEPFIPVFPSCRCGHRMLPQVDLPLGSFRRLALSVHTEIPEAGMVLFGLRKPKFLQGCGSDRREGNPQADPRSVRGGLAPALSNQSGPFVSRPPKVSPSGSARPVWNGKMDDRIKAIENSARVI